MNCVETHSNCFLRTYIEILWRQRRSIRIGTQHRLGSCESKGSIRIRGNSSITAQYNKRILRKRQLANECREILILPQELKCHDVRLSYSCAWWWIWTVKWIPYCWFIGLYSFCFLFIKKVRYQIPCRNNPHQPFRFVHNKESVEPKLGKVLKNGLQRMSCTTRM